jgi:hypothetical protein
MARIAAILAGLVVLSGIAEAQALPGLDPQMLMSADFERVSITEPNARDITGDCTLVNNVWNPKEVPAGFVQSIFTQRIDGEMRPGWKWTVPGGGTSVLSMPEIVCGDKPWDAPQMLRADFPFRAGDKAPLVRFDIDLKAEGTYNMAFSLWAVSKLPAVQKTISLEIMVWNVAAGQQPTGDNIGTVDAAGTTFDLYLKRDQGVVTGPDPFTWPLVQYVARKPVLSGTLDFAPFLDDLMKRQILIRGHYLTSFELGNEVTNGSGKAVIRKLEISFPGLGK